jgi:hypothetical protein
VLQKRPSSQRFPVFVLSLPWSNDHFWYTVAQKGVFRTSGFQRPPSTCPGTGEPYSIDPLVVQKQTHPRKFCQSKIESAGRKAREQQLNGDSPIHPSAKSLHAKNDTERQTVRYCNRANSTRKQAASK